MSLQFKQWLDSYKGVPGVYKLYDGDLICYVGKAFCLRNRVRKHLSRRGNITEVSFVNASEYFTRFPLGDAMALLCLLEAQVIEQCDPVENRLRASTSIWPTIEKLESLEAKRFLMDKLPDLRTLTPA